MRHGKNTDQEHGFRWWWILPGLGAMLGGLSFWVWMRRGRMHIQPVRIDLSFVRSQPFQPEVAVQPVVTEIVIPVLPDEPAVTGANGFNAG